MSAKPTRIVITVDGGVVQEVSMDAPEGVEVEVIVIDYDTDGATKADGVVKVPNAEGTRNDAFICGPYTPDSEPHWVAAVFECEEQNR